MAVGVRTPMPVQTKLRPGPPTRQLPKMGQSQSQQVCTTPACVHTSSYLLGNIAPPVMWEKVDPCTDFDKLVCHGFRETTSGAQFGLHISKPRSQRVIRLMLEGTYEEAVGYQSTNLRPRTDNVDEHNFNMLRQFYQSCMDKNAIKKAGIDPLVGLVKGIEKLWPVDADDLDAKLDSSDLEGLSKAAAFLMDFGVRTFFTYGYADRRIATTADPNDNKIRRYVLNIPSLTLQAQYDLSGYKNPNKTIAAEAMVRAALSPVFPTRLEDEQVAKLATGVIKFEAEMAKAIEPLMTLALQEEKAGVKGAGEKLVTLTELAKLAPSIRLDKILSTILPGGYVPDKVTLFLPEAWPLIDKVVLDSPKKVVQSWLVFNVVSALASHTHSTELEMLGAKAGDSHTTDPGTSGDTPDRCLEYTLVELDHLVDRFYVNATYTDLGRKYADELTTNIRAEFRKRLTKVPWMGEEAKKRAVKKVDNLVQNIGYPTSKYLDLRSPQSLASFYSHLNITSNYFANVLSIRYNLVRKQAESITRPIDREEWELVPDMSAHVAGASYYAPMNTIYMNAGLSQLPFYHPDLPQYVLYGGLGSVIGHEITHGFDSTGRKYDENAKESDWWDNSTVTAFKDRAQCFIDQYSNYKIKTPGETYEDMGEATLGENISDAGGLAIAYNAWLAERKAKPDVWDQHLPGLEKFTHEQLFFITYGSWWCDGLEDEARARYFKTSDPAHAPGIHRIKGGIANSRAFKEAFQCKNKEPQCEMY
ncbi:hypothetical protein QBC35DRAFT_541489 [Podospora australis]|uniref:Uncharacterized protein n=1 Tax=Podospora australis TaxID=1536484 RepID=A0AAN7AEA5_9PEZI|nr:hypothetical protein QBC35DRAFT_541489 [Podospora australis]